MKITRISIGIILLLVSWGESLAATVALSDATQECIECHAVVHPGIVADWRNSRHAGRPLAAALSAAELSRRVSSTDIPKELKNFAVGCAECHTVRAKAHAGTFEHNGHQVHTVVSPDDCAVCHIVEVNQYQKNIMSHAHGNLAQNPVYRQLQQATIDRPERVGENGLRFEAATPEIEAEACYHCHGTRIKLGGVETRETGLGEMEFPLLSGWPNQGVGRVNTDNSQGSCSACHSRHSFSIAMARKPDTCKQCHVGPDVPAAKVYDAGKHGNIFAAAHGRWNFETVPWTIGTDFTAPTCAACHMSLTVNSQGDVISQRTHQISDRLANRLYGLIYAHAHPKEPDTTIIRNQEGLPLPVSFSGVPAARFLISEAEAGARSRKMRAVCTNCHSSGWVASHFKRLKATIADSNAAVKTATGLMTSVWQAGLARGVPQKANPFDESIEKKWTEIWLFQANSIRFAAAMAGGGDYGVFADGRFQSAANIAEMKDWIDIQKHLRKVPPE